MNKYFKHSYLFIILLVVLNSCTDLDENYNQYLNDIKYSSRISNLTGKIGIEKVLLSWKNPEDLVAKRIRIEYGDNLFIETEEMVSSYTITDLTSAAGYNFTIYTLDAYGNKSIGTSVFLTPVTSSYMESFVNRLTTVQPTYSVENNNLVIKWRNMTESPFFRYTGQIDYTYSVNGQPYTGNSNTGSINEETVTIPNITSPVTVVFNYTMKYNPIVNNVLIEDVVAKTENAEIVIEYSTSKDFAKMPGSGYTRLFNIPYDNTTAFSQWYRFDHLFDGNGGDNNSWVSSSPDVDPINGGNKQNNSQWPLSITLELSQEKKLSHIEMWSWENFSQYPKRYEVWGTNKIESGKPNSYWATTIPGEWQNDWNKLAYCETPGNLTLPGYKFEINPNELNIRYVRIIIHEVYKPVNHVRVGLSELMFYEQLPPRLIAK